MQELLPRGRGSATGFAPANTSRRLASMIPQAQLISLKFYFRRAGDGGTLLGRSVVARWIVRGLLYLARPVRADCVGKTFAIVETITISGYIFPRCLRLRIPALSSTSFKLIQKANDFGYSRVAD
jgi:hypothetical protein